MKTSSVCSTAAMLIIHTWPTAHGASSRISGTVSRPGETTSGVAGDELAALGATEHQAR